MKKLCLIQLMIHILMIGMMPGSQPGVSVEGKSFIWRLETGSNQGFILGSIHFLKKDMYPLKPTIEKAFEKSQVLGVEADISASKMAGVMKMTMEKSQYPGDETLEKNLSDKVFQLAFRKLQQFGMDIQFYQKFKPWFLALTISGLEVMKMGYDPNFGVDKYFIDRVSGAGADKSAGPTEIYELEGIAYQIDLFDAFTREENENFLLGTLQEVAGYETDIDEMVKAWLNGDVPAMERILNRSITEYPELSPMYRKFIDERNRQMTEKVMACLKTPRVYFIVVGAAHLVGENGIIKLLEKLGVKAQQL